MSHTQISAHGPHNGALCVEGRTMVHCVSRVAQWYTVCRGSHNGALHGAQPSLTREEHSSHKTLLQHSSFKYWWMTWDDLEQSGMMFWLVRAVTYKRSICRRYLSLASWGEPRWNPCHSLIFDNLSISIEGKTVNPGYSGCKFTHSWEMGIKLTCVCVFICSESEQDVIKVSITGIFQPSS
jgi:hypothetical protein